MTTSEAAVPNSTQPPQYKRKLRNYLIDVGLQIRYTSFIILVAVFLTGVLGYKILEATQDTSKVIWMTGLVDPASAGELQDQFKSNDRVVLFGIVGFGMVLVLSVAGAGIWITHKVAGPLFNIAKICGRIRDGELSAPMRQLRKGDELQAFYSSFQEMYEAIRGRMADDMRVLNGAIAALEAAPDLSPPVQQSLDEMRALRDRKDQSLRQ